MRIIIILLCLIFFMSFASASFGYDNPDLPKVDYVAKVITFNNNTGAVNTSDYWDNLNTPADINTGDLTDDNTFVQIGNSSLLSSTYFIDLKPDGDNDDFIRFTTASNNPYLNIQGGNTLRISSDGATSTGIYLEEDAIHYGWLYWSKPSDYFQIGSSHEMRLAPSFDTGEFIKLQTVSDVPEIMASSDVSSPNLKITAKGGTIDFDDEDLTTTGNIGIGTTPSEMLHLDGGADPSIIAIQGGNADDEKISFRIDNGVERAYVLMDAAEDLRLGINNSADNIKFETASTTKMMMTGGGLVGIGTGTATPLSLLEIRTSTPTMTYTTTRTSGGMTFQMIDLFADNPSTGKNGTLGRIGISGSAGDESTNPYGKFVWIGVGNLNAPQPNYANSTLKVDHDSVVINFVAPAPIPDYPFMVIGNVSGITGWFDGNVSASGYTTRTSVFDESKNVWDYIRPTEEYLKADGEIDHSKFYGYSPYEIKDLTRPVYLSPENIIYPYNTTEEAVSLNMEIDLLRKAVYELKQEVESLKSRISVLEGKAK